MSSKTLKEMKELVCIILVSVIIAVVFRSTVMARVSVVGNSMDSTLTAKDSLIIEKVSLLSKNINRGEIVILDSKNENSDQYIKRVLAVEGDTIEIKNGKVYLNNAELKENYLDKGTITKGGDFLKETQKYVVPKNYVFVMGDNRNVSYDSRYFGAVNVNDLKGHAIIRVYPFSKVKIL